MIASANIEELRSKELGFAVSFNFFTPLPMDFLSKNFYTILAKPL